MAHAAALKQMFQCGLECQILQMSNQKTIPNECQNVFIKSSQNKFQIRLQWNI